MQQNKRKILIILIIFFVIIISIKPIIYTYNYLFSNLYIINNQEEKAEKYILRGINFNPGSYRVFRSSDYLLQAACLYKKESLLNTLDDETLHEIKEKYKDNFYVQNIYGNLDLDRNWSLLDSVSYRFLKNKRYNSLTLSILDRLGPVFSEEFIVNLLDFLYWQENEDLADYFIENYNIVNFRWVKPDESIDYPMSIKRLNSFLQENYSVGIWDNLLSSEDFLNMNDYSHDWYFSTPSKSKPFGKGSFFVDLYQIDQKSMVKAYNLLLNIKEMSVSNVGIWLGKKLEVFGGYYILSFDYWLKTGQEKPRLSLAGNLNINWLEEENRKWIKVICVLNNSKRKVEFVMPFVRIFGLGSLYVDNVFFSKVHSDNVNFEDSFRVHYLYYEKGL